MGAGRFIAASGVGALTAAPTPHVAYVITHYPSPSHTFIYGEIRALQNLGMRVSPISVNPVSDNDLLSDTDRSEAARTYYIKSLARGTIVWSVLSRIVAHPRSFVRTIRLAARMAGWDFHALLWHVFHVVEAIVVLRRCQAVGATHLHSHFGGLPSTIALYASELSIEHGVRRLPWSVTVHGYHEFANERSSLLQQKVREASFVACISDFTRSQLMRIVGDVTKWPNVHVVRCGIDLSQFQFEPRPLDHPPRIMVTARVVAEKGLGVLFDAVAILSAKGIFADVIVVGDGPARAAMAERVAAIGLDGHVRWMGFQPPSEVLRWLRDADIFCLPSFAEGLPIVLMEAMAAGVPVVGTFLGGIPELVQNGRTGYLVPAGRADLLADALETLSTASPKRDLMIRAARQQVEDHHEMHQSARQLFELFESVGR